MSQVQGVESKYIGRSFPCRTISQMMSLGSGEPWLSGAVSILPGRVVLEAVSCGWRDQHGVYARVESILWRGLKGGSGRLGWPAPAAGN